MKRAFGFVWMILPFVILVVLAGFMIAERSGMVYVISYPPMQFLKPDTIVASPDFVNQPAQALIIYDSNEFAGNDQYETVLDTLDSMRIKYDTFDVQSGETFEIDQYQAIVITLLNWPQLGMKMFDIVNWTQNNGGRLLVAIRPDPSEYFSTLYRKMGILSKGDDFVLASGVSFKTDLLPGAEGMSLGKSFILHSSYPLSLDPTSELHITSADRFQTPILWEYDLGSGRVVFINSDQFNNKSARGVIGSAYSLLFDVFAYPVINGSVFFIDDFPSPIRQGSDPLITEQYGRDIQSFYINVWWPDLAQIANQHGIRFTGVIVETYNDVIQPPFEKQPEIERHRYFGGLVLDNGGELGLHGYNHVPLCLSQEGINQRLQYPGWESTEAMQLSLYELYTFSHDLFPDNEFVTYVPASNILCASTREWLPKVLPDLRVISSVYLPEEDGMAYEQEFTEAEDGIVEFPRIIAGYDITEYMWWVALNELGLHYINSHFVHPDDVLDVARGSQKGWETLRNRFDEYVTWLYQAAPSLRNLTAREGGMAVQRFDRLGFKTEYADNRYHISIDNFYDEAWFIVRTSKSITKLEGGTFSVISSDKYLVKALQPDITIHFGE